MPDPHIRVQRSPVVISVNKCSVAISPCLDRGSTYIRYYDESDGVCSDESLGFKEWMHVLE